jgi:hypothetical protein
MEKKGMIRKRVGSLHAIMKRKTGNKRRGVEKCMLCSEKG